MISQLYRACAAGQPGLFSKVGLYTYVDPRFGGAKVNEVTTEDIVKYHNIQGEEWLFYIATKIDVAFIRGTSADPSGNISMEKEALVLDNLAQAMAARNNGGIVIAQVERIVEQGSIRPKDVEVPGILVDCVVVAETPELHRMNYGVMYNPALSGEIRVPVEGMAKMPLDERKVIARRAAFELPPNGVVNLGVGAPEGIAAVANEEKFTPYITLTTEAGAIGGVLASGSSFGGASNADSIIQQNQQFDFYDGGGLDMTCLGMAECDVQGNVNTSKFGGRLNGRRRFHQHQPERPQRGFRRHLHQWRARCRDRGRQGQDHQGRAQPQIPELRRADHLLRQIRAKTQAAGDLRDGALRVPAPAQGAGTNRGRARN